MIDLFKYRNGVICSVLFFWSIAAFFINVIMKYMFLNAIFLMNNHKIRTCFLFYNRTIRHMNGTDCMSTIKYGYWLNIITVRGVELFTDE